MPHLGEFSIQKIPFTHLMHFSIAPPAVNVLLVLIKAGCVPLPYRVERLAMSVDPAPGGANAVSFTLSNGIDSMTVTCTGAEVSDINTAGFNVDPVTQDLTLHHTADAAALTDKATISICRRYI